MQDTPWMVRMAAAAVVALGLAAAESFSLEEYRIKLGGIKLVS